MGSLSRLILIALSVLLTSCGSGSTTPSSVTRPPDIVYEPGNGVSIPTVVREVRPSYTSQAIAAGIQGRVVVAVVVLPDGTVGDVTVTQSLDTVFGLDAQAVTAARQWLFNPGTKDGRAVAVRVTIEFTFALR